MSVSDIQQLLKMKFMCLTLTSENEQGFSVMCRFDATDLGVNLNI